MATNCSISRRKATCARTAELIKNTIKEAMIMKKAQVDAMVNKFLAWKLPEHFHPDAGISFTPTKPYTGDEYGNSWWPVGTNLFTADQAREMILHILSD